MAISQAFGPGRQARGVAIDVTYDRPTVSTAKGRPIRIAIVGIPQATASVDYTKKYDLVSREQTADLFGKKCPIFQAYQMLNPANAPGVGDIPVTAFPVEATAAGAQAVGSILIDTIGGPATATSNGLYRIKIGDRYSSQFAIATGDGLAEFIAASMAACNAVSDFPCIASDGTTALTLTAGWEGATGNDLGIEVETITDSGLAFTVTDTTGGAGTIDIDDALGKFKDVWYSHVINCEEKTTDNYNKYYNAGELRRAAPVHKAFTVFFGTSETDVVTAAAITDARDVDRQMSKVPVPNSSNFHWEIAARGCQAICRVAHADPAMDYGSQQLTLLDDGGSENAWSVADGQDQYAVARGHSTTFIKNGVLRLGDVITAYHPEGEDPAGFQYVCDQEKNAAVTYGIINIFKNDAVDGSPLPNEEDVVTNPNAKKPSYYKSELIKLYEALARSAIITDVAYAIENTQVQISGSNPKRLDVAAAYKLVGNANVISIDQRFTFNLGGGA